MAAFQSSSYIIIKENDYQKYSGNIVIVIFNLKKGVLGTQKGHFSKITGVIIKYCCMQNKLFASFFIFNSFEKLITVNIKKSTVTSKNGFIFRAHKRKGWFKITRTLYF
jgi:hypothetical protein